MTVICLHDRTQLAAFFGRNAPLHAYALGDLDNFYWPHTQWYGLADADGTLREAVLLYTAEDPPVLQALTQNTNAMRHLLSRLLPLLPTRLFLHLSPGLRPALTPSYIFHTPETHLKLVLRDADKLSPLSTGDVVRLTPADAREVTAFYDQVYPEHWFDARGLETGQYFGIRQACGGWACAAGVHVYSPTYGVAALGNVVTRPDARGRGLATRVCAALCRSLRETCGTIGLNVRADNAPALACYRHLGFVEAATYEEVTATRKPGHDGHRN